MILQSSALKLCHHGSKFQTLCICSSSRGQCMFDKLFGVFGAAVFNQNCLARSEKVRTQLAEYHLLLRSAEAEGKPLKSA